MFDLHVAGCVANFDRQPPSRRHAQQRTHQCTITACRRPRATSSQPSPRALSRCPLPTPYELELAPVGSGLRCARLSAPRRLVCSWTPSAISEGSGIPATIS